ncbi:MAG: collagen binding domain-containing protein [Vicinamibacterales bacterium]
MKLLLAFGLIVAMMGAASVPLHACSCAGPGRGDVCGPERSADAIFVGTVIGITDVSPGSFGTSKLVTLAVTEPFKNANAKVIDVGTGRGGGDCGFPFAVGTSYLVFAHERTGTGLLTTGICSNTKHAANAPELSWLRRSPTSDGPAATIEGRVRRVEYRRASNPGIDEPQAGIRLTLRGDRTSVDTVTDANGHFVIDAPQGMYTLDAQVPSGWYSMPDVASGVPVRLTAARGCPPLDIRFRSDGRIVGRLVDGIGNPIPFLTIDLAAGDGEPRLAEQRVVTDAGGRFQFLKVAPDRYRLGVAMNLAAVRDDTSVPIHSERLIDVGLGASVQVGDVVLPAHVDVHELSGVVQDETGGPIEGAEVRLVTGDAQFPIVSGAVMTDALGRFRMSALGGRSYSVQARHVDTTPARPVFRHGKSDRLRVSEGRSDVVVIVKPR